MQLTAKLSNGRLPAISAHSRSKALVREEHERREVKPFKLQTVGRVALVPMLCVGTHIYDCLSMVCVTTQERGNEEPNVLRP